jgi:hypothetical protein
MDSLSRDQHPPARVYKPSFVATVQPSARFRCSIKALLLLSLLFSAGCESSTNPLDESGGSDCASQYLEGNTPLRLVMPFAEGSEWTVGNLGSFFGEGAHRNDVRDSDTDSDGEFFATDWNCCGYGNSDENEPVYPIAPGRVSVARDGEANYGNNVIVVHPGNPPFRSRYAHLSEVTVIPGQVVFTTTLLGKVGNTGTQWAHLHLVFQRWSEQNQNWRSKRLSGGNDTGSRKPSPLWTAQGSTELCNAATLTAAKGVSVFHDVDPGDLFARYITSVYAHGYVVGCSNEPYEFCPGRSLSRADMAVVIVRSEYGQD